MHPENSWPHYGGTLQGLQHDWGDEYICHKLPVQTHSQASRPGPATFLTLFLPSTKSIPLASMPSAAQPFTGTGLWDRSLVLLLISIHFRTGAPIKPPLLLCAQPCATPKRSSPNRLRDSISLAAAAASLRRSSFSSVSSRLPRGLTRQGCTDQVLSVPWHPQANSTYVSLVAVSLIALVRQNVNPSLPSTSVL